MESKADRIRAALKDLVNNGHRIYYGLAYEYANPEVKKKIKEIKLDFNGNYEKWYSEARESFTLIENDPPCSQKMTHPVKVLTFRTHPAAPASDPLLTKNDPPVLTEMTTNRTARRFDPQALPQEGPFC